MSLESLRPELRWAIEAAQNKQAMDVTVLNFAGLSAFVESFLVCSGTSARQIQAIAEEIEEQLERRSIPLQHREGRAGAEWVLLDYGRFVVHIFSERARLFYDLERLWRSAQRVDVPPPGRSAAPDKS